MKIRNTTDLQSAILVQEEKRTVQYQLLLDQIHYTFEKIRPVNLIKNSLNRVGGSSDVTRNIINASIGLSIGLLSKRLLIGRAVSFPKKILRAIIELGIANIVIKNTDTIRSGAFNLFRKIFKSRGDNNVLSIELIQFFNLPQNNPPKEEIYYPAF